MYFFIGSKHYLLAMNIDAKGYIGSKHMYLFHWKLISSTPKQFLGGLKDISLKLEVKLNGSNQNKAVSLIHKEATLSKQSKIFRWKKYLVEREIQFTTTMIAH
jgi:hypothetical protein